MLQRNNYVGQTFGKYHLLALIADSTRSQVYIARSMNGTQEPIVLKMLTAARLTSSAEEERFLWEVQRLLKLQHAHILPLLDAGIEMQVPYLVMRNAPGGSLRQRLASHEPGIFSLSEVLTLLMQIGRALEYAHRQGIFHGDIKAEDILFDGWGQPFITNFPLPIFTERDTARDTIKEEEYHYTAPEQFMHGVKTSQSDQYALASLGYEILAGHTPFRGSDRFLRLKLMTHDLSGLSEDGLPQQVKQVLLKALSKEPSDRYATMMDFVEALLMLVEDAGLKTEAQRSINYPSFLAEGNLVPFEPEMHDMPLSYRDDQPRFPVIAASGISLSGQEFVQKIDPQRVSHIPYARSAMLVMLSIMLTLSGSILLIINARPSQQMSQISSTKTQLMSKTSGNQGGKTVSIATGTTVSSTPTAVAGQEPTVAVGPTVTTVAVVPGHQTMTPLIPPTAMPDTPTEPATQPAQVAPLLLGSISSTPSMVDLSGEGTLDWAQWGYPDASSFNHKGGVTSQISPATFVGNSSFTNAGNNAITYGWNNGMPITNVDRETFNIWTYSPGNGFQLTAKADTTTRTLRLYVGVNSAQGTLTASLSNGGKPLFYQDSSFISASATAHAFYTITYRSDAPDQTLTITFKIARTYGNAGQLDLEAATLQ